jgi:hypothetical protein
VLYAHLPAAYTPCGRAATSMRTEALASTERGVGRSARPLELEISGPSGVEAVAVCASLLCISTSPLHQNKNKIPLSSALSPGEDQVVSACHQRANPRPNRKEVQAQDRLAAPEKHRGEGRSRALAANSNANGDKKR